MQLNEFRNVNVPALLSSVRPYLGESERTMADQIARAINKYGEATYLLADERDFIIRMEQKKEELQCS